MVALLALSSLNSSQNQSPAAAVHCALSNRPLLTANPLMQKSKKAAAAPEGSEGLEAAAPVVVPAVVVSPDVVVLPAASLQAVASSQAAPNGSAQSDKGASGVKGPTGARAFKRVNDEEWLGKKGAWDNSYEAKFGSSGYGAKASQTLLQVKKQHLSYICDI